MVARNGNFVARNGDFDRCCDDVAVSGNNLIVAVFGNNLLPGVDRPLGLLLLIVICYALFGYLYGFHHHHHHHHTT